MVIWEKLCTRHLWVVLSRGDFLILRYFILESLLVYDSYFSDIDFVSNLSLKDNFVVEHLLK